MESNLPVGNGVVISKNTSAVVSATSGSLVTGMRTAGFGGKRGGGGGGGGGGNLRLGFSVGSGLTVVLTT